MLNKLRKQRKVQIRKHLRKKLSVSLKIREVVPLFAALELKRTLSLQMGYNEKETKFPSLRSPVRPQILLI